MVVEAGWVGQWLVVRVVIVFVRAAATRLLMLLDNRAIKKYAQNVGHE
ncbi:MAG: hypothetical protein OEW48_09505 [Phycisphaerae bacterium]|nr:hypothetical protein [Phycisphaerae bacterium]